MKLNKAILSLALLLALAAPALAADEYKIDPKHSSANFAVRHLMVSTVRGRFSDVSGGIVYDEKDVSKSSVTAVIKTASLNTDEPDRDKHLRGADFFEVEQYPEITFVSKRVEKRGDKLVALGTLTMKGVAKEIELPFTVAKVAGPRGTQVLGVQAETTLNRFDYGVQWNRLMEGGGAVVGNEVRIELNLEARTAPPPAAAPAQK